MIAAPLTGAAEALDDAIAPRPRARSIARKMERIKLLLI
jgi:hypothetical protein